MSMKNAAISKSWVSEKSFGSKSIEIAKKVSKIDTVGSGLEISLS